MGFDDGRVYGESWHGFVGLYRDDLTGICGQFTVGRNSADRGRRARMGDLGHWFLCEFALCRI